MDEALKMFPADYWRYFLMATRPETKDSNFSWDLFLEKINSDLNDTLGNFIHRTLTFINSQFNSTIPSPEKLDDKSTQLLMALENTVNTIEKQIESFNYQSVLTSILHLGRIGNQYFNEQEPWKIIHTDKEKASITLYVSMRLVKAFSILLAPFMPTTAFTLQQLLNLPINHQQNWSESLVPFSPDHQIKKANPLFQKISANPEKLTMLLEKIRSTE